eukprot:gene2999-1981_t
MHHQRQQQMEVNKQNLQLRSKHLTTAGRETYHLQPTKSQSTTYCKIANASVTSHNCITLAPNTSS